jgi:hypothetical protein
VLGIENDGHDDGGYDNGGSGGRARRPGPLEPPSSQPKHDPMRCAGREPVAGGDEEQQREAQLQFEARQREAQQLKEEQQREALRVPASGAGCGAGAATAAATTKEAAAGRCDRSFPKQASVEARLHGAGCGAAIAVATANEAAAGGCDGPVPKQAAAAADAGALVETSTRTQKDKLRPKRGETQLLTRTPNE